MPVVRFIFAANQTTDIWILWINALVAIPEALPASFLRCSIVVQKMLDIDVFAAYTPSEQQLNNGV